MNEIKEYTEKVFEDIKHIDENGNEYWLARELMEVLEYSLWQNFHKTIKIAMMNCNNSNYDVSNHFIDVNKMINLAKNAIRKIQDYKLTRYACYLIAQNGDSRKKTIALAQTYFAIQTRKQELSEKEYAIVKNKTFVSGTPTTIFFKEGVKEESLYISNGICLRVKAFYDGSMSNSQTHTINTSGFHVTDEFLKTVEESEGFLSKATDKDGGIDIGFGFHNTYFDGTKNVKINPCSIII